MPILPPLLRNGFLQGIIRVRLYKELPHSFEHAQNLGAWFPILRLEDPKTHVTKTVVGHVGVVDTGDEFDSGGFEGVVGWQGEDEAEAAWEEGGFGGSLEGYVPGVDDG